MNTINRTANRGQSPHLSSTVSRRVATLMGSVALFAAVPAKAQVEPTTNDSATVLPPKPVMAQPAPVIQPVGTSLESALAEWKTLQQADNYPFASYAAFLVSHRNWPGETAMRKSAEKMLKADGESPSLVVSFFRAYAPETATGLLRFAQALDVTGAKAEAQVTARKAWAKGALSPDDEMRLLSRYGSLLQQADHDERMENLLWQRSTSIAARQITMTSATKRPLFQARLAFLSKAPDAAALGLATDAAGRSDAGYIADKAWWLRNTNQVASARMVLSQPREMAAAPVDPARWLRLVEDSAKGAVTDGQAAIAFNIARQAEYTYAPGTVVRDRPYAERDMYTNITWLAGRLALEQLGRPAEAIRMFELYGRAAKSPQTRAKGLYWAARAAEAAGKKEIAGSYFTEAATFYDQFYGQLALEKLGRKPELPADAKFSVAVSGADRAAFGRNEVARAIALLGRQGNRTDQLVFIRALASSVNTAEEHVLAAEFATSVNRPDLSLLIGKSAREDGHSGYVTPAYPMMQVPDEHKGNWTMVHAITRQESQFDRTAQSRVGARGLMQLMPGTARETAPAAGISYSLSALTENPQDNIRLGSTYFGGLMTRYSGSYILSVAAYNAGPGNVNKWLAANGDPRLPGVDKVKWIENIPFTETRNYVQRVLENAVVYDLLNPARPATRPATALSSFLAPGSVSYGAP